MVRKYAAMSRHRVISGTNVRKVRSEEDDWCDPPAPFQPALHEQEPAEPYFSGIVTEFGEPIMCYPSDPLPIGFLWHDEEGSLRPKHEFFED